MPDHADRQPSPQQQPPRAGSSVDLPTLAITAASSAIAAFVCSKVWVPGTLASAAFTPVIVALLKEALRRPAEVVTNVVPTPPLPRVVRPLQTRGTVNEEPTRLRDAAAGDPGNTYQGLTAPTPPGAAPTSPLPPLVPLPPPRRRRLTRHWKGALAAGLLGFVIAALAFTIPELIAGEAVGGGDRRTTILGGKERKPAREKETPSSTQTTTVRTETVTTPAQETTTVTVPAPATTTTPAQTTPTTAAPSAPEPGTAAPQGAATAPVDPAAPAAPPAATTPAP